MRINHIKTISKKRPYLPYGVCLAIWAISGPCGAAAAASGRWYRASLEALLSLGGIFCALDALKILENDGQWALADSLAAGNISSTRLWIGLLLLCMSTGLWVSDWWRMGEWHGRKKNPLLDPTTLGD